VTIANFYILLKTIISFCWTTTLSSSKTDVSLCSQFIADRSLVTAASHVLNCERCFYAVERSVSQLAEAVSSRQNCI